jgi:hypothetical protein
LTDTITLITKTHEPAAVSGARAEIVAGAVAVDAALIRKNIDQCLTELKQVFSNLAQPSIEGWSVGTVTVGLTVTAQGSVGIATAGIEAALEITFKPNG